jgi:hypothetical protein
MEESKIISEKFEGSSSISVLEKFEDFENFRLLSQE